MEDSTIRLIPLVRLKSLHMDKVHAFNVILHATLCEDSTEATSCALFRAEDSDKIAPVALVLTVTSRRSTRSPRRRPARRTTSASTPCRLVDVENSTPPDSDPEPIWEENMFDLERHGVHPLHTLSSEPRS